MYLFLGQDFLNYVGECLIFALCIQDVKPRECVFMCMAKTIVKTIQISLTQKIIKIFSYPQSKKRILFPFLPV